MDGTDYDEWYQEAYAHDNKYGIKLDLYGDGSYSIRMYAQIFSGGWDQNDENEFNFGPAIDTYAGGNIKSIALYPKYKLHGPRITNYEQDGQV